MKRVITYGTVDLLHYGHINFLRRANALGVYLIVSISTDERKISIPITQEISSIQIKNDLYDANMVDAESKISHDDIATDL